MINRNNYPIYEPVFKNWNNIGAESEAKIIAEQRAEGEVDYAYIRWQDKKEYLDILRKNYNWMYMEVRFATKADEERECKWCREKLDQYEVIADKYGRTTPPDDYIEINEFRKGDVVIREQTTTTGFDTLHIDCAQEKLAAIRESIARGEDTLHSLIIASEHIRQPRRRRSNQ